MRRFFIIFTALLLGLSLFAAIPQLQVMADVGNNNSYSNSGGSSGGYSSGNNFSSSSNGSSNSGGGVMSIPLVIIIVLYYLWRSRNNQKGNSTNAPIVDTSPEISQSIEAQIRQSDPDFSSGKFLSWSEEVFMTLQDAWTKRDWKIIRPFENETLFNKHSRQLEEYIRNNTINVIERICINKSMLSAYNTDSQYEYLTVYLETRMNDYIIDANTNQVVKGDKDREFFTNYNLKFMRSLGVKTTVNSGKSTTNCPNCGAPTQITSAGECEYCNSVITTGQHDWVLFDLDSVG